MVLETAFHLNLPDGHHEGHLQHLGHTWSSTTVASQSYSLWLCAASFCIKNISYDPSGYTLMIMTTTFWPCDHWFLTPKHTTCRISQGHSFHQVWRLWDDSFLSYAAVRHRQTRMTAILIRLQSSNEHRPVGRADDDDWAVMWRPAHSKNVTTWN